MAFSFFMRDQQVLELAVEHMVTFATGRSRIKIWDAGCAFGQETWSIAMLLAERMNRFGFKNVRIDATDHDIANNASDAVTKSLYSQEELKRTPQHLVNKYFECSGVDGVLKVSEQLRDRVVFRYHDLLSLEPISTNYCLVLCKNVLLHLGYEERISVFRMFYEALTPGGFLAMEQTQKLPPEVSGLFEQVVPVAQLYRRVEAANPA